MYVFVGNIVDNLSHLKEKTYVSYDHNCIEYSIEMQLLYLWVDAMRSRHITQYLPLFISYSIVVNQNENETKFLLFLSYQGNIVTL